MNIIPAIDLKNNQVVHARYGERGHYMPLATPLFPYSDPLDVITRLHNRHGYRTFYIADLGAITGTGSNEESIRSIISRFPDFNYWIDAGIRNYRDYKNCAAAYSCVPVVGSETLVEAGLIAKLFKQKKKYILSLDFKNQVLLGSKKILQQSQYWSKIVITLSLNTVGGSSPDFEVLKKVTHHNRHSHIVIGGGVRTVTDLTRIRAAKVNSVLMATAIYTNQLSIPVAEKDRKPQLN